MDLELGEFVDFAAPSRIASAVRRGEAERKRLVAHSHDSRRRRDLEEFVRDEFFLYFKARVRRFMPQLLALHDRADRVHAVVGCRRAAAEPLFLETYMRDPVERSIARRTGVEVARDAVVEIGGLACCGPRAAREMVEALIPFLLGEGFTWVVFTGTDAVKDVFRRINLAPTVLCRANPELLRAGREDWGSYYDHNPEVMAGRLRDGAAALQLRKVRGRQGEPV